MGSLYLPAFTGCNEGNSVGISLRYWHAKTGMMALSKMFADIDVR